MQTTPFETADTSIASNGQARLDAIIGRVLPDHARERYFELEHLHAEDLARANAVAERISEAVQKRTEIRRSIGFMLDANKQAAKGATPADEARLESARAREAAATEEIERLQAQRNELRGRAPNLESINDYLIGLTWGREFKEVDDPHHHGARDVTKLVAPVFADARADVKPRKGQTDSEGLAEAFDGLAKSREERKSLAKLPPSQDEIDARIDSDVKVLARKGVPDFAHLLRRRIRHLGDSAKVGGVRWPGENSFEAWDAKAAVAFACWLDPEGVAAKLKAEIRKRHGNELSSSVTSSERDSRVAELNQKIAAQERTVEAWAVRCERSGASFARTWQSKPEAILGIRLVTDEELFG